MKFLADEHFPMASVHALRDAGHDVVHVGHVASGEEDVDLVLLCEREGRTLLTFDKDFGDLAFRDARYPDTGVVLFRLKEKKPRSAAGLLLQELAADPERPLAGRITVITENGTRFREFEC